MSPWNVLSAIAGTVLLYVVVADIVRTTISLGRAGPITTWLARTLWRRLGRHSGGGPSGGG